MKNFKSKNKPSVFDYIHNAILVAAALVLFLASAAFIIYKAVSVYNYNERWKDYDECGLS